MKKSLVIVMVLALCLVLSVTLVGCGLLGIGGSSGSGGSSGKDGKSAYEIAVENGYEGTLEEWLDSLAGKSAYEQAVENGFEGTFEDWQNSLKGEDGSAGERGSMWYAGSSDPNVTAPDKDVRKGDFYFRTYSDFATRKGFEVYTFDGVSWIKLVDMSTEITAEEQDKEVYHIVNLDQFVEFRNAVNAGNTFSGKTIYLDADIDMSSIDNWEPIGNSAKPFKGKFDGKENTISNLRIKEAEGTANNTTGYLALFGKADTELKNFTLTNASVIAPHTNYVSAVVATSQVANISNVKVYGEISIEGYRWVGGILGNGYAHIYDCEVVQNSGSGITSNFQKAGGIAGQLSYGTIEDSHVKATITGKLWGTIGGLIGGMGDKSPTSNIKNNEVDVILDASEVDIDAVIYTSYSYAHLTGALIGNPSGEEAHPVTIEGNKCVAKITSAATVMYGIAIVGPGGYTAIGTNDIDITWNGAHYINGVATIDTAEQLLAFAQQVNGGKDYKGETVMVGHDIDLSDLGTDWTPIGTDDAPFKGTFDGRGYTISNLTVDDSSLDNVGLFGRSTDGAIIKNFTLKNVKLTGNHYVASVVGNAYTTKTIEGITVEDAVLNGTHWVAGIVGSIYGDVYNCHVSHLEAVCTVENLGSKYDNGDKVGGIVGQLQDSGKYKVDGCSVDNAQLTAYRDVGGLVGCGTGSDKTYSNNSVSNVHIIIDRTTFYGDKDICADFIVGRHGDNDTHESNQVDEETCSISYVGFDNVVDSQGNWHIYNAKGFVAFQQYFDTLPNNGNAYGITVTLEDDIYLAEVDWQPIGFANTKPFKDVFDGQGHTIFDMTIKQTGDYIGLFSRLTNNTAEIKNVVFENVTIAGGSYVGTVAGRVGSEGEPKLSNITVKGNIQVSGGSYVGAIVGHIGAVATNLTVNAKEGSLVRGRFDVGGLAGTAKEGKGLTSYTKITTNIDVFAEVYGNVGGLVGRDQGGNRYEDCKVHCNLIVDSGATDTRYNMINACFGDVAANGTTVDGFTFEGLIMGGSFTGFCESYAYDVQFTNSTAVVTRDGQEFTFTADASGNITDNK